ncbi:MAG: heme exporter protein CcmD [Deltaproteobacteria bacterium]|nr:heme exporter protein CcmD [Deltaproteobacteria bacterium]
MSATDRFWFLFAAYGAIWILLAVFLMHLGRRHRALERELRDLESRVPPRSAL